jgi:hypothetical protein
VPRRIGQTTTIPHRDWAILRLEQVQQVPLGREDFSIPSTDGGADVFRLAGFLRDDKLISHDGSFGRIDSTAPAARTYSCYSACNFGSDAILVHGGSVGAEQSGLKEVDFSSTVHLAFDELELGDLPLCLAVGPRQSDCGADGGFILGDAIGE